MESSSAATAATGSSSSSSAASYHCLDSHSNGTFADGLYLLRIRRAFWPVRVYGSTVDATNDLCDPRAMNNARRLLNGRDTTEKTTVCLVLGFPFLIFHILPYDVDSAVTEKDLMKVNQFVLDKCVSATQAAKLGYKGRTSFLPTVSGCIRSILMSGSAGTLARDDNIHASKSDFDAFVKHSSGHVVGEVVDELHLSTPDGVSRVGNRTSSCTLSADILPVASDRSDELRCGAEQETKRHKKRTKTRRKKKAKAEEEKRKRTVQASHLLSFIRNFCANGKLLIERMHPVASVGVSPCLHSLF